ncbi:MAG: hypothetical protein A2W91_14610 [Bacteroidetes bacterium GWF2_38_335]|nr:MAG: hypothetical protein A2W91_14610 [Bacteroidetes bacterium GWF2_38_335]OFY79310.1 MAG: hypothetical protein A2281_16545 [Bacteroidetes bacterium RIFOXYA12_FULL_38_20]HBS85568.1 hypothetical protein [Bacteroidales bacterium]
MYTTKFYIIIFRLKNIGFLPLVEMTKPGGVIAEGMKWRQAAISSPPRVPTTHCHFDRREKSPFAIPEANNCLMPRPTQTFYPVCLILIGVFLF